MAGGSIDALVQGRHPASHQFDLGMVDGPILVVKIPHRRGRQALVCHQVKKPLTSAGTRLMA